MEGVCLRTSGILADSNATIADTSDLDLKLSDWPINVTPSAFGASSRTYKLPTVLIYSDALFRFYTVCVLHTAQHLWP